MLADLVEGLSNFVENLVVTFGTPGIYLIALLENLFPPTPSELLYPLSGKMAYDGDLSLPGILLAGVLGSLTGSLIYYALGYYLGESRTLKLIDKYGQINLRLFTISIITTEEYHKAREQFENHGNEIVFVARLIPLVHAVVSIPAGVMRMNLVQFILYTSLGSAAWIMPLAFLGYWMGDAWEEILRWLDVYSTFWYALIGLAVVGYILYRSRQHHQEQPQETHEGIQN